MELTLNTLVEKTLLSNRTKKSLIARNIICIKDLITQTKKDILETPNLGQTSLSEIRKMLSLGGFSLFNDSKTINDYELEKAKMSLRDNFAMHALQGLLSSVGELNNRALVFAAYEYADMMIETRSN